MSIDLPILFLRFSIFFFLQMAHGPFFEGPQKFGTPQNQVADLSTETNTATDGFFGGGFDSGPNLEPHKMMNFLQMKLIGALCHLIGRLDKFFEVWSLQNPCVVPLLYGHSWLINDGCT